MERDAAVAAVPTVRCHVREDEVVRVLFSGVQAFGEGKDAPHFYLEMDRVLNARIADHDYGPGLTCWFLVFGFQRDDLEFPRGPERVLRKRKTRELDLRLFVDHVAWRDARKRKDPLEQYRILFDTARRSFDIIRQKKIAGFDVDRFERDIQAIAHEQGWTR